MPINEKIRGVELLTTEEVAGILKVAPLTLVDWRYKGKGPVYHRMLRQIRYKLEDITRWMEQALDRIEPDGLV